MTSKRSADHHFDIEQYNNGNLSEELFAAAKDGDIVALEKALKSGANPNFISSKDEGSPFPLHESVKINVNTLSIACTKLLLEHGANANLKTITTKNTPLHEAALNGNEHVCRLLIDSATASKVIEESNAYGNSSLHAAIRGGNVDVVRLLLDKDISIINAKNHLGSTPLHLCAFLAHPTDVDKIKETTSASLDGNRKNSTTNRLVVQPHLQIAAILLSQNDFKMIDERDHNGYTALHVAASRGCNDLVKLLVDSGANLFICTAIDLKGRGGRTASGMAKFAGKTNTYELLLEMEKSNIDNCDDQSNQFVSFELASDLLLGYSISNPIVGGGIGVRRKSNYFQS